MLEKIRFFAGITIIFAAFSVKSQTTVGRIAGNFIADPELRGSTIGIKVIDLTTGESLVSENSDQLMAPASTLKLVTSATALELLGPGYRFRTSFGFTGNMDESKGLLDGNLVVRGEGDPTLGSLWFKEEIDPDSFMENWISILKGKGISRVSGKLVADISAFEAADIPGSWTWDDIGNYYGAGPSALTVYDNLINLYFNSSPKPGEPVKLVRTEPGFPGIEWQNQVTSSIINRDMAFIYGSPWGEKRKITGTIPAGRKEFQVKASMPEPPRFLGNYFRNKLQTAGITIEGGVEVTENPQSFQILDNHYSPELSHILTLLNHESINLFAEHLVFQLALEKTGRGSYHSGLQIIKSFWKGHGIKDTLFLEDGSGLSRFDAVSAAQLAGVLQYMVRSSDSLIFRATLPVAGEGTLTGFSIKDFPGLTLQCKSGSLNRVRSYAGYMTCNSGRKVAFAVMVNNFSCSSGGMGNKLRKLLLEFKQKL